MVRRFALAALAISTCAMLAQSPAPRPKFDAFEVATVKPVDSDPKSGRFITMQGQIGLSKRTTR